MTVLQRFAYILDKLSIVKQLIEVLERLVEESLAS